MGSVGLIVAFGLPLAWILARRPFWGRTLLSAMLTLPLVLPPTVLGFVLLRLLGRQGPLGHWLESTFGFTLVFHWSGAVLASSIAAFPLFLIPARNAIASVDTRLEDAARLLGRNEHSVFNSVTLPLAWRGLMAGLILAFARTLGDFGTTLMVAGNIPGQTQTAALAIYDAVNANRLDDAAALASVVALVSLLALSLVQVIQPQRGLRS